MGLTEKLAEELVRKYPDRAAAALERIDVAEAAQDLHRRPPTEAAEILSRLSPVNGSAILSLIPMEGIERILETLPSGVASRLLRRIDAAERDRILATLPGETASPIRSLLTFPPESAGALMDPHVLAVQESLTAKEALDRVREVPQETRYNVYVLGAAQRLVGVVNLRELFLAKPRKLLGELMTPNPLAISATANRSAVVSHPGWKVVHSLPVVDGEGAYLGAIRYRTLRSLEDELSASRQRDADTRDALAGLFSAGVGGLLGALSGERADREDT